MYLLADKFKGKKIILASESPRRKKLLEGVDIPFKIGKVSNYNETYPKDLSVKRVPQYIANQKSLHFSNPLKANEIVITADTIVVLNGKKIGKPKDRTDAIKMLGKLSGHKHTVVTGVCIRDNKHKKSFSASSDVWFGEMTKDEICRYVDKYKPYDKAGAYGVQEWIGYIGIIKINGSFYNVMGLPIQKLYRELLKF